MGSAVHARKTKVLVDGYDLSNFFNKADTETDAAALDSTCFDEPTTDKSYAASVPEGKVSLSGLFQANPGDANPLNRNKVDDVLSQIIGDTTAPHVVTVAHEGMASDGLSATLFQTKLTKYSVSAPANALISCMAEMQADGGLRYGYTLARLLARTTGASSAVVDLGAATTAGFRANLHATVVGSSTTLNVIVEDSADGATGWATIGTFAGLTALGAQAISTTGNVRRYVRATWTFTGTNGATFAVSFALNPF
jgi:hypothetical protein